MGALARLEEFVLREVLAVTGECSLGREDDRSPIPRETASRRVTIATTKATRRLPPRRLFDGKDGEGLPGFIDQHVAGSLLGLLRSFLPQ